MWYESGRKIVAFGGGLLDNNKTAPQPATPSAPTTNTPIDDTKQVDSKEKAMWDKLINEIDFVDGGDSTSVLQMGDDGKPLKPDGFAAQAINYRRLSPHHTNPEMTTLQEQLESVRHENPSNPYSPQQGRQNAPQVGQGMVMWGRPGITGYNAAIEQTGDTGMTDEPSAQTFN